MTAEGEESTAGSLSFRAIPIEINWGNRMTDYQIPVTLPRIRRRYAEIAPNAVTAGTPEPALPLAGG